MNELMNVNNNKIFEIRGQRAMLDKDVAAAMNETTASLNQNAARSPKWEYLRTAGIEPQYRMQVNDEELNNLRSQFVISSDSKHLPWVYTRKGCLYFGTSMNGPAACEQAVQLVEAFDKQQDYDQLSPLDQLGMLAKQTTAIYEALKQRDTAIRTLVSSTRQIDTRLVKTESDVSQMKATVGLIGNYVTVMGYANLKGVPVSSKQAAAIGKLASGLCKSRGVHIDSMSHMKYGKVNTYPEEVLALAWDMFYRPQPTLEIEKRKRGRPRKVV